MLVGANGGHGHNADALKEGDCRVRILPLDGLRC